MKKCICIRLRIIYSNPHKHLKFYFGQENLTKKNFSANVRSYEFI